MVGSGHLVAAVRYRSGRLSQVIIELIVPKFVVLKVVIVETVVAKVAVEVVIAEGIGIAGLVEIG
ncbi:hypothetical protein [Actinoplanes derwentensis]|uniref:Uncharacterized protein n=1 Tax=Actinoplanes derwentensis TaxID=113562 RepID=A0A1H2C4T2_9ACTN|nr:hypothetical protein [Actinoplanes derwentensis]SDT65463.1 hypothetical protein SAMN04489716_5246 [Actinoplanes derwentensis]